MSVPFTITVDNWQYIDKAEELRLALSERNFMLTRASNHLKFAWNGSSWSWSAGDGTDDDKLGADGIPVNMQAESFWRGMQSFYESNCEKVFLGYDETRPLFAETDDDGSKWQHFCEYLPRDGNGLYDDTDPENPEYGWRKCSSLDENGDPVFTRGQFSAEDYLGPWIIEDILFVIQNWTDIYLNSRDPIYDSNTYLDGSRMSATLGGLVVGSGPTSDLAAEQAAIDSNYPVTSYSPINNPKNYAWCIGHAEYIEISPGNYNLQRTASVRFANAALKPTHGIDFISWDLYGMYRSEDDLTGIDFDPEPNQGKYPDNPEGWTAAGKRFGFPLEVDMTPIQVSSDHGFFLSDQYLPAWEEVESYSLSRYYFMFACIAKIDFTNA